MVALLVGAVCPWTQSLASLNLVFTMMEQDDACHTSHGMKEIRIVKTTGKPGKACPQSLGLREGGRRPSTGAELKEPQGLEVQGAAGSDSSEQLGQRGPPGGTGGGGGLFGAEPTGLKSQSHHSLACDLAQVSHCASVYPSVKGGDDIPGCDEE